MIRGPHGGKQFAASTRRREKVRVRSAETLYTDQHF
jgi:hypothetical protein